MEECENSYCVWGYHMYRWMSDRRASQLLDLVTQLLFRYPSMRDCILSYKFFINLIFVSKFYMKFYNRIISRLLYNDVYPYTLVFCDYTMKPAWGGDL